MCHNSEQTSNQLDRKLAPVAKALKHFDIFVNPLKEVGAASWEGLGRECTVGHLCRFEAQIM